LLTGRGGLTVPGRSWGGSDRRVREPLSGLCGGRPLTTAARARAPLGRGLLGCRVALLRPEPLPLRRRARRGLSLLDRDDTEAVGRRLRPLLLLAVLVGVGAGLLRASDGDDRALHECGVLGVTTKQGHAVER